MIRTRPSTYLVFATALLLPVCAFADATLLVQGSDGQSSIQLRGGMGRMDTADGDYMLFDRARNVVIRVEPADGGYTQVTEDHIGQMAQAAGALRSQLGNLPPAQRAIIEERMNAMLGVPNAEPAPQAPITAVRKGRGTVAGMTCEKYELRQGNGKIGDACMADAASGNLSKDDFATLEAMMAFLRKTMTQAAELAGSMGDQMAFLKTGLPGVPLSVEGDGETFAVTSVSGDELEQSLFTDYRNLKEKVIPVLGP